MTFSVFRRSGTGLWLSLIAVSVACEALLAHWGIPAFMLLGPMIAAIGLTTTGAGLRIPPVLFVIAQGVLGCMIAGAFPSWIGVELTAHWFMFACGVISVIAASCLIGLIMTHWQILPGSTALWGLSPGAATAMTLMAEAYGADAQLVAFMQYLRVVLVALVSSFLAGFYGLGIHHNFSFTWLFSVAHPLEFGKTLLLAVPVALLASRLRFRAGALLVPLILGVALTHFGVLKITMPLWLLSAAYALIGWRIGLRFNRQLLIYALKKLPQILLCNIALILVCGLLAYILVRWGHIDPLTAWLATSPGGADTAAIIAASSHVDFPFVMAMQMLRFIAVLIIGPLIAKSLTRHITR